MNLLALLLLVTSGGVVLVDEVTGVLENQVKAVNVDLTQKPAVVEVTFDVLEGELGEISLIGGEGPDRRYLRRVFDRSSGVIRYPARRLGTYQLVLDNRGEGQGAAKVRLRIDLDFDAVGLLRPGTVPAGRRSIVVALSVLFILLVAIYTGRKLKAAIATRHSAEQPPLFL